MKILGVDPGSLVTGIGVLTGSGSRFKVTYAEAIQLPRKKPLAERLGILVERFDSILRAENPDVVVFEKTFHGASSRSLIVLAHARGALLATAGRLGLDIEEYSPAEIKSAVAGSGRAEKGQVQKMIRLQLGYRKAVKEDVTDALAAAFCFALRGKLDRLQRRL